MGDDLGWDLGDRAAVLAAFYPAYTATQLVGAWLAMMLGPKKVLVWAMVLWSLTTMATPAAARVSLRAVCGLRVLLGLFEGVTYPATFSFISPYLKSADHGTATARINIGASLGAVFAFAITPAIVHHLGWEAVFTVFGLLGLAVAAAWALLAVEKDVGPQGASQLVPIGATSRPGGGASATAIGSLAVTFEALGAMVRSRSVLTIVYCGFAQAFGVRRLRHHLSSPASTNAVAAATRLVLWITLLAASAD